MVNTIDTTPLQPTLHFLEIALMVVPPGSWCEPQRMILTKSSLFLEIDTYFDSLHINTTETNNIIYK